MIKKSHQDAEATSENIGGTETRESAPGSFASPESIPSPMAPQATQLEIASYIEDICLELASLARRNRLKSLGYFIDMVRLEASTVRLSLLEPGRGEARPQARDISPPG